MAETGALTWQEDHGVARVVGLQRPPANALEPAFLREIGAALQAARDDGRAVVLTARGPIFCAGLDLGVLLELGRDGMQELLDELYGCLLALYTHPAPVVAAINGHAIAGGALLTAACDRRYMAQGEGRWGLPESQLGLPVPAWCIELLRYAFPRPLVERLVYGGSSYPAFKALDMRVIDDLVEADQLLDRALGLVGDWSRSPHAFADVKARLHAPTADAMARAREDEGAWLDQWFSPAAQERLVATRDRLSRGEA